MGGKKKRVWMEGFIVDGRSVEWTCGQERGDERVLGWVNGRASMRRGELSRDGFG